MEGVTLRAERHKMLQMLADVQPGQVREGLMRVIALANRMHVVPAHDVHAYDPIREWTTTRLDPQSRSRHSSKLGEAGPRGCCFAPGPSPAS